MDSLSKRGQPARSRVTKLLWYYFPAAIGKGIWQTVAPECQGFRSGAAEGTLGEAPLRTQTVDPSLRGGGNAASDQGGAGLLLAVPLDTGAHDLVVTAVGVAKPLDAHRAFEKGMARVAELGRRVVVDTPDLYFNAGVGASCAAMYGLYVAPCFVHGGVQWRGPLVGWRLMDGPTAYGWHDLVATDVKYHLSQQLTQPNGNTAAEADAFGAEQSRHSIFWGLGRIPSDHYDMQTQFFDQCVRNWRATGDAAFEKLVLPALELHLRWAKACFDPGDTGLYESYINTWPTDSVWYNGGGTVEESAYIYHQQRAIAEMCLRAGRAGDGAKHNAEADKIRDALNRVLWLKDKGWYAAYVEQGGHRRVHDDAWIYSEHLPIEAGLATPEQAWQAMYYTDRAMQHYRLPYGGEMRQTSNWVPGQWSVRELYAGDNFAMALGYFLAGQGDEGWELLRGAMLESMYGDPMPKAGYGGGMANHVSPGALSQPKCSIDFNDITSMFCRSVVEGLFGYRPDYPNGVVTVAPALPAAWDHASIKTPDYSLAFKRDGDADSYTVGLARPARMRLQLPVRAERVSAVNVNGKTINWKIEPWAGYGMLDIELPESGRAEVAVTLAGRTGQVAPVTVDKRVGESKVVAGAIDPQGCLASGAGPGHHMAFARVARGNVPYFQVYKVDVSDPGGDAVAREKDLREAPAGARWDPIAMTDALNGDIREIFKQKYLSPRPATASCRIGYDGWSAWTFQPWKIRAPDIKLDLVAELVKQGRIVTPQKAVFAPPGDVRNIALTSLWDNWPRAVTVPVNKAGDAAWLLVCGSTNPMQGRIANAVLTFHYADGRDEKMELIPPLNFWSLCRFGGADYNYDRDGFALPKDPPPQVQLGQGCRAMVYGWKLRPGVELKGVTLETLSQEVVIGLMGLSIMNPASSMPSPP